MLLHFTATWAEAVCGPHRAEVAHAANALGWSVREVGIDREPETAKQYVVLNVPAVAVEGDRASVVVGAVPRDRLVAALSHPGEGDGATVVDETVLVSNLLESLDRLYDRVCSPEDVRALVVATLAALTGTTWQALLAQTADSLAALTGPEEKRYTAALVVTEPLRRAVGPA
jgi:hypothetical protein